jgi:hypothetical protein
MARMSGPSRAERGEAGEASMSKASMSQAR